MSTRLWIGLLILVLLAATCLGIAIGAKTASAGAKHLAKRQKPQWSKVVCLLVILAGFFIVQECLFLMYLCIQSGYVATAAWLTAGVGVGEAVIIAGANGYFSLCKSDHSEGGITFEAAKAKGFIESSTVGTDYNVNSPPI